MNKFHLLAVLIFMISLSACSQAAGTETVKLCTPQQLSISGSEMSMDGGLMQGFTFTNTSDEPCSLPRKPEFAATDALSATITISQTGNPDPAAQLMMAPQALAILTAKWISPCIQNENDPPLVLLLAGKKLELPAPAAALPACTPGKTPVLQVSNFNSPP